MDVKFLIMMGLNVINVKRIIIVFWMSKIIFFFNVETIIPNWKSLFKKIDFFRELNYVVMVIIITSN